MYTLTNQNRLNVSEKTRGELLDLLNAYQQAIDVNVISSITDLVGTILHVNDKFCEVSKYSREELIGRNHSIINSRYHSKEFFSVMWKTISSGKVWHDEIRNKAKDGSFYWVETVILPILNKEEKIHQYLSLRLLITDRKRAEEERKEYTQKLQEMLRMTSHRVRSPLSTCMGLINLIDDELILNKDDMHVIIQHLKTSAVDLNKFTIELTRFMSELETKYGMINIEAEKNK